MKKAFLVLMGLALFSCPAFAQQIDVQALCAIDPSQLAVMDLTAVFKALNISSISELQQVCAGLGAQQDQPLDPSQLDLGIVDPAILSQVKSIDSFIASDGTLTALALQLFSALNIGPSFLLGPDFKVTPDGRAFLETLLQMILGMDLGGDITTILPGIIFPPNSNDDGIKTLGGNKFPFDLTSFDLDSYFLPDGTLTPLGRLLLEFLGFDVDSLLDDDGKLTAEGRKIITDFLMQKMQELGIEYEDFFDEQGELLPPFVELFNENTGLMPENMSDLFGDQVINLTIGREGQEDFNVGIALQEMQIVQAQAKHFDSATVSASVSAEDFKDIAISENPFEVLQEKMDKGAVDIKVHGFWNNVKYNIFKAFLSFKDALEWSTSSAWRVLGIGALIVIILVVIGAAVVSFTRRL